MNCPNPSFVCLYAFFVWEVWGETRRNASPSLYDASDYVYCQDKQTTCLKKERKKWKEISWHTPSKEFYSFSPSSHLLRRQNPLSVPVSPSGKAIWVLIRRSKRSHSPPALGEFQNQTVHVRIPLPVRVQFLNKTQGKGIPLGKSGCTSWTVTSGSMPSFTGGWGTQGSGTIGWVSGPCRGDSWSLPFAFAAGEEILCGQPPAACPS